MNKVTMIGLDLAKNVFQVHGVDASGEAEEPARPSDVSPFYESKY